MGSGVNRLKNTINQDEMGKGLRPKTGKEMKKKEKKKNKKRGY